jgi:GxxExxY protein
MKNEELTYKIRGAIFEVYNVLGPGLLENVYEKALIYELSQQGLKVKNQVEVPVRYKDVVLNCDNLRLDIIVNDTVIIELKSVDEMKSVFYMQLRTYLRLADKPLGILVNFKCDNIAKNIFRISKQ